MHFTAIAMHVDHNTGTLRKSDVEQRPGERKKTETREVWTNATVVIYFFYVLYILFTFVNCSNIFLYKH